jgi:hypothetical protein
MSYLRIDGPPRHDMPWTTRPILAAFEEFGSDVSYCPDCGQFQGTDSRNCNSECMGEDCIRYEDLRYELEVAFRRETEAMGKFVTAIAEALGVKEEPFGGFAESRILEAIGQLKREAA